MRIGATLDKYGNLVLFFGRVADGGGYGGGRRDELTEFKERFDEDEDGCLRGGYGGPGGNPSL